MIMYVRMNVGFHSGAASIVRLECLDGPEHHLEKAKQK